MRLILIMQGCEFLTLSLPKSQLIANEKLAAPIAIGGNWQLA